MKITFTSEFDKGEIQGIFFILKQKLPDEWWEKVKDQTVDLSADDLGDESFDMRTVLFCLALRKIGMSIHN